jgi:hypothetical protein
MEKHYTLLQFNYSVYFNTLTVLITILINDEFHNNCDTITVCCEEFQMASFNIIVPARRWRCATSLVIDTQTSFYVQEMQTLITGAIHRKCL